MARYKFWHCPDCGGTFKHLHHPDDEPPPDRCLLCGSWMSESEPAFVPQAPAVRNPALVRAVDDVYFGMEDATKANAERMAEMMPGASASDFSHTVVTDMNDRQKPGDIAWKPPPMTPGSRPGNWSGGGGMMLPEYAHIAPGAGKSAAAMIQQHHMRANGQPPMRTIGTYMPPRS